MHLQHSQAYIEAILQLRNTTQFTAFIEHLTQHRNTLLISAMSAPDTHTVKLLQRAAALSEIINSVVEIEEIREEYERNGST